MKKTATTPTKVETAKAYANSTIKVALALAFMLAALSLAGYLNLNAVTKEVLAAINGILGIWILVSNVR